MGGDYHDCSFYIAVILTAILVSVLAIIISILNIPMQVKEVLALFVCPLLIAPLCVCMTFIVDRLSNKLHRDRSTQYHDERHQD